MAAAERQAINTVIQGSASELIKVAMLLVQARVNAHPRWQPQSQSQSHSPGQVLAPVLLMQIHDELVYEVPLPGTGAQSGTEDAAVVAEFVSLLRDCMEHRAKDIFQLSVPLVVNIQTSFESWGTFKKYDDSAAVV